MDRVVVHRFVPRLDLVQDLARHGSLFAGFRLPRCRVAASLCRAGLFADHRVDRSGRASQARHPSRHLRSTPCSAPAPTSARPTAGHRANKHSNTVSEEIRIQTRNDEVLILKFATPKHRRRCAPAHWFKHTGPCSGADARHAYRVETATLPRAECECRRSAGNELYSSGAVS